MEPSFKEYGQKIINNCHYLANTLIKKGFKLITGGSDNHLLLIDLSPQKITGKKAALLLEEAGIVVNKNCIPFDPLPPSITSGIRLGTPALTTREMGEEEMRMIGQWISKILSNPQEKRIRDKIKTKVQDLSKSFPVYG